MNAKIIVSASHDDSVRNLCVDAVNPLNDAARCFFIQVFKTNAEMIDRILLSGMVYPGLDLDLAQYREVQSNSKLRADGKG